MGSEAAARTIPNTFPTTRSPDWAALRAALRVVPIPKPIELHLIRHGETEPNRAGLVTGSSDVELSETGREQARRLGEKLASEYSIAVSSTMARAKATVSLALEARGAHAQAMYLDPRLNERALGEAEGRPAVRITEYAIGDLDWAPQGGEPYRDVARRVLWFLLDVAIWASQRHDCRVLVSAHSGPLRILLGTLDKLDDPRAVLALTFENASITQRTIRDLELPRFLKAH